MTWWNSTRKELIYNRIHATSIYTLIGITILTGAALSYSAYSSVSENKERKQQFVEGKLPSKS